MPRYDLNADVGEGFPFDLELMSIITSANVACGFHAGDAATMQSVCAAAAVHSVAIGAQVSYRDRAGFGRRDIEIEPAALYVDLVEQIEALALAAQREGVRVSYLKPHGALYNRSVTDPEHAGAVVAAARQYGLPVLALPESRLLRLAGAAGLDGYREFFADRGYDRQGRLLPRSHPNALISDVTTVAARVRQLVEERTVTSVGGIEVAVEADSICVHGDTPGAVELAMAVRDALGLSGATLGAFG